MLTTILTILINVIAIAINGAITVMLVQLLQGFFKFKLDFLLPYLKPFGVTSIQTQHIPFIITGTIMVVLVFFSLTPIADIFLRFIYGFRKPIRDEKEKLQNLFEVVCKGAGKNPNTYKLYVVDEEFPNAYALGINNIAVTRRLLQNFSNNEIKGVIAHEVGHLHYGDSIYTRVFMTVSIIGQIALIFYTIAGKILVSLARIPIPFLNLFSLFAGWAFSLQAWVIEILLLVPLSVGAMFGSRQNEYRADRYAYEIGQGEGLYAFLHRILDDNPGRNNGLLNVLRASHPKTGNRIRKLEEAEDKAKARKAKMMVAATVVKE